MAEHIAQVQLQHVVARNAAGLATTSGTSCANGPPLPSKTQCKQAPQQCSQQGKPLGSPPKPSRYQWCTLLEHSPSQLSEWELPMPQLAAELRHLRALEHLAFACLAALKAQELASQAAC